MTKNLFRKIAVFVSTLFLALTVVFAHKIYLNRQGIFNYAAWNGNITLMKSIALLGIDVDSPGCNYQTCPPPIVLAAWYGENEAVLYLLNQGADINNKQNYGRTALMMAAYFGREDTVKLLISNGANINQKSVIIGEDESSGETALDFAKSNEREKIVQILQNAGAK